jgi:phage-related protein
VAEEQDKPLAWLHCEIKTPPFSKEARIEVGALLRRLQQGGVARPPTLPADAVHRQRCHELRVTDKGHEWRIVYRADEDAIVIGDVFAKTSRTTPRGVIERCQKRLEAYDRAARGRKKR